MSSATEAAGDGGGGRGEEETRSERVAAHQQVTQLLRVAGKAFTVGCGLQLGVNVLGGIANRKLFKSPVQYLCHLVSKDTFRFGGVFGLSAAVYRATLALLRSRASHLKKFHTLIAGLLAGMVSAIDKSDRRKTLALFMTARALGMSIIILNRRGVLPTIPHFVTALFGMCQAFIIVAVTRFPSLLPPTYYRAILRWSQYYNEEKLEVYFRRPTLHQVPCNGLLHKGSCHSTAFRDFYTGLWLYFNIYVTLYSLPMVLINRRALIRAPLASVQTLLRNSLRSALFFAADATIVKYLLCVLRNAWPHPPPLPVFIPFLAGASGAVGLLIERKSRRVELLYYVLPQVLYSISQIPLPLSHIPFSSVLPFSLSLAIILATYKAEKAAVAPFIQRAIEFLLEES